MDCNVLKSEEMVQFLTEMVTITPSLTNIFENIEFFNPVLYKI